MLRPLSHAYHVTVRIQSTAKQLGGPLLGSNMNMNIPNSTYLRGILLDIFLAVEMLLCNNAKYLVVNCKGILYLLGRRILNFIQDFNLYCLFDYQVYHNHYSFLQTRA